jgi:hypothetical protein
VSPEDEPTISEINILPDGRVCLFGASQQVLEVLDAIPLGDLALKGRIERLHAIQKLAAQNDEIDKDPSKDSMQ